MYCDAVFLFCKDKSGGVTWKKATQTFFWPSFRRKIWCNVVHCLLGGTSRCAPGPFPLEPLLLVCHLKFLFCLVTVLFELFFICVFYFWTVSILEKAHAPNQLKTMPLYFLYGIYSKLLLKRSHSNCVLSVYCIIYNSDCPCGLFSCCVCP